MNTTTITVPDNRDIFEKYPDILVFLVVGCSILGVILVAVCVYRCALDYKSGNIRTRRVLPRNITNTVIWGVQNYQSKRFEQLRNNYSRKDDSV